ncbi:MAG: OmpA family protein [Chitinophagales bacterium]|nr:OmpA family protein [Chitinophagales bacterium]
MKASFLFLLLGLSITSRAQDLKPTASQALMKVKAIDDNGLPQAQNTITFSSTKDGKEYSGNTDAEGKFAILLPVGQKYKVKYKAVTIVESNLEVDLPARGQPYAMTYTITVTPPRTFTLDDVLFDTGKSTLRPESNSELNELAEYMLAKKKLVIEIAGHTDNVGAPETNLKLSENRAITVKTYLEKKGVAPERIIAKGYGDTEPVEDNNTAAGRQKNRRTEVRIVSQ